MKITEEKARLMGAGLSLPTAKSHIPNFLHGGQERKREDRIWKALLHLVLGLRLRWGGFQEVRFQIH